MASGAGHGPRVRQIQAVTVLSRRERIPLSIGHFGRIRGTCPLTKRLPTFEVGMFGSADIREVEVSLMREPDDAR
jgi:hypothetical protein